MYRNDSNFPHPEVTVWNIPARRIFLSISFLPANRQKSSDNDKLGTRKILVEDLEDYNSFIDAPLWLFWRYLEQLGCVRYFSEHLIENWEKFQDNCEKWSRLVFKHKPNSRPSIYNSQFAFFSGSWACVNLLNACTEPALLRVCLRYRLMLSR